MVTRVNIDTASVAQVLPAKFSAKGLHIDEVRVGLITARREEFQRDWERNLRYLLPPTDHTTFDEAWALLLELANAIGIGK